MARERHYYRIKVHRFPPYSSINGSYYYEEDVYAYSKEGAYNTFCKRNERRYGRNIPEEIIEITKEEFRGNHKITHIAKVEENKS